MTFPFSAERMDSSSEAANRVVSSRTRGSQPPRQAYQQRGCGFHHDHRRIWIAFVAAFWVCESLPRTCHARTDTLVATTNPHLVDARLDPIVNPGACSGHVHSVMGNAEFQALVTEEHLTDDDWRNHNGKEDQTTSNVIPNLSIYWAPSMYIRSPFDNRFYIVPSWARVYYRITYDRKIGWEHINPFPKDLRLVIGDASRMTNIDPSELRRDDIRWTRKGGNRRDVDKMNHGDWQYLKDDAANGIPPPPELEMKVDFPSCLEVDDQGRPLTDSPDHRSHAKYLKESDTCPTSHPYHIPTVDLEIRYTLEDLVTNLVNDYGYGENRASNIVYNTNNWYLSTGDRSGGGAHVDFISGWPEELFAEILDNCRKEGDSNDPTAPSTRDGGSGPCPLLPFFELSRREQVTKTVPFNNPMPEEAVTGVTVLPGHGANSVCRIDGQLITPAPTSFPTSSPTTSSPTTSSPTTSSPTTSSPTTSSPTTSSPTTSSPTTSSPTTSSPTTSSPTTSSPTTSSPTTSSPTTSSPTTSSPTTSAPTPLPTSSPTTSSPTTSSPTTSAPTTPSPNTSPMTPAPTPAPLSTPSPVEATGNTLRGQPTPSPFETTTESVANIETPTNDNNNNVNSANLNNQASGGVARWTVSSYWLSVLSTMATVWLVGSITLL